jgi:hypothetical protein
MPNILVAITASASIAPFHYDAGERYLVPEDTAAQLIKQGSATAVEVHTHQLGGDITKADAAAALKRMKALEPLPPHAPPAPTSAPPAAPNDGHG